MSQNIIGSVDILHGWFCTMTTQNIRIWIKRHSLVNDVVSKHCSHASSCPLRCRSCVCWLYLRHNILRKNIWLIYTQHIGYIWPAYTYMFGKGAREVLGKPSPDLLPFANHLPDLPTRLLQSVSPSDEFSSASLSVGLARRK